MSEILARIFDEPYLWDRNLITLVVRDESGAVLMRDATWKRSAEGEAVRDMGILLPRRAVEPIAAACAEWQGHTSHADTEARVLREWLAVERERVERVLAR